MRCVQAIFLTLAALQSVAGFTATSTHLVRTSRPLRTAGSPVALLGVGSVRRVALVAAKAPVAESAVAATVTAFLQSTPGKIIVVAGIGYWWKKRADRKAAEEAAAKEKKVDFFGALGDLGGALAGATGELLSDQPAGTKLESEKKGKKKKKEEAGTKLESEKKQTAKAKREEAAELLAEVEKAKAAAAAAEEEEGDFEEVEEVTYEYVDEDGNVVEVDEEDESVEIVEEEVELTGNAVRMGPTRADPLPPSLPPPCSAPL